MTQPIDLREHERQAFRLAKFKDGLIDIQYGILLMSVWLFLVLTHERDYSTFAVLGVYTLWMLLVMLIPKLGHRYITAPRIGRMKPGPVRRAKLWKAGVVIAVLVVIQIAQVLMVRSGSWDFGDKVQLLVPGFIFAVPLVVMAYFNDFPRGYLYALFLDVGITWLLLGGGPEMFLATGAVTLLIGIYLLNRFIRRYPRFEEAV